MTAILSKEQIAAIEDEDEREKQQALRDQRLYQCTLLLEVLHDRLQPVLTPGINAAVLALAAVMREAD